MSNLPSLHLLLLLLGLGLQCPEAQGRPVTTTQNYDHLIHEIHMILNKSSTSIPQQTPSDIDKSILKKSALLRPNLDAFLKATEDFRQNFRKYGGSSIGKNLREMQPHLPMATPQTESISIKNDWEDFRGKLYPYLETLKTFLKGRQTLSH